ncbi:hypothetical protein Scep_021105 [Stephania cephalantha]|uniref:Uncharacterized protein n=1 Tax=Stephania cephalantha TaxID=152367 RepID=A0AAP0F407_9MAGN
MEFQLPSLLVLIPILLGLISSLNHLLWFLNWTWTNFLRPPKDLKGCYGSWALVTGAADGIGRAISFELANRGLNLVLLDCDAPKLETTAKEILHGHDVEVRTLVSDLCVDREDELVRKVREVIEGLDVGVVINNAGTTHRDPLFFDEVDDRLVESIVRVNVEAATWVTKAVVPGMLERKRGVVVNIGSGSASCSPSFPLFRDTYARIPGVHTDGPCGPKCDGRCHFSSTPSCGDEDDFDWEIYILGTISESLR